MTSTKGSIVASSRNRIAALLGALVVVLGVLVLFGWHTQNMRLLRVYPGLMLMAYNTAVSFVLLGGALVVLSLGFRVLARVGAAGTGALILLGLVESVSGVFLRASTLLGRFTLPSEALQAAPVAPNTAIAIVSLAIAMLLLCCSWNSLWRSTLAALLASAPFTLGVNALAGYIGGFKTFAWGQSTPMAIHTSIGLIFLGAGVLTLSWPSRNGKDEARMFWLLPVVAAAGLITSISFWRALEWARYAEPAIQRRSGMPETVLIFGLLVTALLGAAVYLAETARRQMHLVELAERDRKKTDQMRLYLASIVDSSGDAIIGKDLDGTILSWNPAAEKIYGYSAQEIVGHSISTLCPPDRLDELTEILQRVGRGEKIQYFETERVRKDGLRIQLSLTVSPIREPDGRIVGASTIARDITARKRAEDALKANEALLRSVMDSSTDFIFAKDRQLRIILCNQAYANALGKPITEICGKPDIELGWDRAQVEGDPATGTKGWQSDDRAALNGEAVQIASEPCNVAGEIHFFNTVKTPFRDAQGEIIGLVGVSRDITERKRAEHRLWESEEQYRTLFNSIDEGFCTIEVLFDENNQPADYRFLEVNPSFERQTGILDAAGRTIRELVPQLEQDWFEKYGRIALTGEAVRFQDPVAQLGRWYDVYAFRVGEPAQRRVAVLFNDITERMRTEWELRQASAYNRSLIEASLDPLVTIAPDGKITDVNHATEQATGLLRQALIGSEFCDYFTDQDRARAGYQRVFKQGWTQDYELEIRHRDGSIRPVLYNASLYRNEAGETIGIFAAARDITERKRVEEEIKELNAGLERRIAERTADLLAVNHELESFNYTVSHDLRAPLRHIDGYSKILLDHHGAGLTGDGRQCVGRIRDGARRMGRMVDELLELSRTSRCELSKQLTGLRALVADVVEDLKQEIPDRAVEWRIGDLPFADCDPLLTRQAIANLLANAVKFTRDRKPAVIEVGQLMSEGQTVLFVRDNGVGFSMKYADKLFGVFQRLHRREDFEGTGVGLVTVQRIIHKHGGRIWAEAELEKGATFYFTLEPPAAPQPDHNLESKSVLTGER